MLSTSQIKSCHLWDSNVIYNDARANSVYCNDNSIKVAVVVNREIDRVFSSIKVTTSNGFQCYCSTETFQLLLMNFSYVGKSLYVLRTESSRMTQVYTSSSSIFTLRHLAACIHIGGNPFHTYRLYHLLIILQS